MRLIMHPEHESEKSQQIKEWKPSRLTNASPREILSQHRATNYMFSRLEEYKYEKKKADPISHQRTSIYIQE
jgi:hypothetical protein